MLHFECPSCHAKCQAAPDGAGSTVACSTCGKTVNVPKDAAAITATPALAPLGLTPLTGVTTPELAEQQQAKRRAGRRDEAWSSQSIAKTDQTPQRSGAWLLLVGLALGGGLLLFMAWDSISSSFWGKSKGPVVELTDANWQKEVVESQVPVVVDFWAPWCGPCVAFGPTIDKLAVSYEGRVKVGKLNVDEAQKVAAKYKVSSIPCVLIFNGGDEPVLKFTGVQPEAELARSIDRVLAKK